MGKQVDESAIRALVGGWPGVEADVKWQDDLVFSVAGKMFCCFCLRGSKAGGIGFKVDDDRFLELTDRPGFVPAPYLAKSKWVLVAEPGALPADEFAALLRRSYELVRAKLTKKLQRELAE